MFRKKESPFYPALTTRKKTAPSLFVFVDKHHDIMDMYDSNMISYKCHGTRIYGTTNET